MITAAAGRIGAVGDFAGLISAIEVPVLHPVAKPGFAGPALAGFLYGVPCKIGRAGAAARDPSPVLFNRLCLMGNQAVHWDVWPAM